MKRTYTLVSIFVMVFWLSLQAHATLYNRGADSLGNNLIYDSALNVTWYDYTSPYYNTNTGVYNTWQNQVDWADALTVNFKGTTIDNWRLPSTVDGPLTYGYDGSGTYTYGYNITNSEMGYLYYVDLGNKGSLDTSGYLVGSGNEGLLNAGPFDHLLNGVNSHYWSGTEYAADSDRAWHFYFNWGDQYPIFKDASENALAVRPGDVAVAAVPELGTMFLLGSGIVGLIASKRLLRRRDGGN